MQCASNLLCLFPFLLLLSKKIENDIIEAFLLTGSTGAGAALSLGGAGSGACTGAGFEAAGVWGIGGFVRGIIEVELALHQVADHLLVLLHHELAHDFVQAVGLQNVGIAGLARGEDRALVIQQRGDKRTVRAAVLGLAVIDFALEFEIRVVSRKHIKGIIQTRATRCKPENGTSCVKTRSLDSNKRLFLRSLTKRASQITGVFIPQCALINPQSEDGLFA